MKIYNEKDLMKFRDDCEDRHDVYAELEQDIYVNENWREIIGFTGVFDGKGHTITFIKPAKSFMFYNEGVIKNLRINGFIQDRSAFCYCNKGILRNCENSATVNSYADTRGICYRNEGDIQRCENNGILFVQEIITTSVSDTDKKVSPCFHYNQITNPVMEKDCLYLENKEFGQVMFDEDNSLCGLYISGDGINVDDFIKLLDVEKNQLHLNEYGQTYLHLLCANYNLIKSTDIKPFVTEMISRTGNSIIMQQDQLGKTALDYLKENYAKYTLEEVCDEDVKTRTFAAVTYIQQEIKTIKNTNGDNCNVVHNTSTPNTEVNVFEVYKNAVNIVGRLFYVDYPKIFGKSFKQRCAYFNVVVKEKSEDGKVSEHRIFLKSFTPTVLEWLIGKPEGLWISVYGTLEREEGKNYVNVTAIKELDIQPEEPKEEPEEPEEPKEEPEGPEEPKEEPEGPEEPEEPKEEPEERNNLSLLSLQTANNDGNDDKTSVSFFVDDADVADNFAGPFETGSEKF